MLHLHHELEDIAALVASEAVIQPLVRIDRKGRRLLLVERAQALPATAAFLEAHVIADNVQHIGRFANASDGIAAEVDVSHGGLFSHRGRQTRSPKQEALLRTAGGTSGAGTGAGADSHPLTSRSTSVAPEPPRCCGG